MEGRHRKVTLSVIMPVYNERETVLEIIRRVEAVDIPKEIIIVDDAPAKIVFDKFHIAKHPHDAVDLVREAEHRALKQAKDDRLTNAGLEAVNAAIRWVKKTARGIRNVEHFKTAIYFHCGGLDRYPHETR